MLDNILTVLAWVFLGLVFGSMFFTNLIMFFRVNDLPDKADQAAEEKKQRRHMAKLALGKVEERIALRIDSYTRTISGPETEKDQFYSGLCEAYKIIREEERNVDDYL